MMAARGLDVCRAGSAGRGTAFARGTERHTLASFPDPRQGLGSGDCDRRALLGEPGELGAYVRQLDVAGVLGDRDLEPRLAAGAERLVHDRLGGVRRPELRA